MCHRTGRYKPQILLSSVSGIFCFTLLLSFWHGNTPTWQALFIFFGGFATGITLTIAFIDLAATVDDTEMSIASSGLYLSANIGSVAGVSISTAVFGTSLKYQLENLLADWPDGPEVRITKSKDF
jgi:predicted MFS family arabinose efflux permease